MPSLAYPVPTDISPVTVKNTASLFRIVTLALISGAAIASRLFSIINYESVIHEFDPWFNYRATRVLAAKGFYEFWNWFDPTAWYPLGRVVGGTVYPGLMATSGVIYYLLQALNLPVDIRNICVLLAPGFSALTAWATYMFTKEMKNESAGLLAAAFIGIVPGYISRSVAGSYDNEAIAIFLLMFTFYLWIKALKQGSALYGTIAAVFYFYMVAAWGGYVFITNMIPVHALVLILMGRFSHRLYVAYCSWYAIGTLASMQVPFVGFQPVSTSEHMGALGVFGLLQIVAFAELVRSHVSSQNFQKLLRVTLVATGLLGAFAFVFLTYKGKIAPWTGRFYSLWDTGYAKKYIPIIASVSEHQPTAWPSFFMDLQMLIFVFPAGVIMCFRELRDEHLFVIIYSVMASYFAGVMVRLMLTLTPVVCVASAIALSTLLETYINPIEPDVTPEVAPGEPQQTITEPNPAAPSTPSTTSKKAKKSAAAAAPAGAPTSAISELVAVSTGKKATSPSSRGIFGLDARLVVVLNTLWMLFFFVFHCTYVTSSAYSSPSVVLASQGADGSQHIIDDFREAYYWLRQNTPEDAVVMSWWDYGYQIAGMADRPTLVDNNTWNNTHIATVGKAMSSSEENAYPILRKHDVDYVLVIFGGLIGYSGDDINKFLWMVRIAQGVWPDEIQESNYFTPRGEYRIDDNASRTMRESLMYKMTYYRFADLFGGNQAVDRVRNQQAPKNIELDYLDEAFTSENWIVRIYQVRKEDILGRDLKSANAFEKGKKRKRTPDPSAVPDWDHRPSSCCGVGSVPCNAAIGGSVKSCDIEGEHARLSLFITTTTSTLLVEFAEMAFTNASNFMMDNTQIYAIANQTNIHTQQALDNSDPRRMLLNHSAVNAMADSPDVYEPTCHPGTRKVVTDRIMAWARDPKGEPILWLSGPAGAGKSCIQRTIVQSCTAEDLFLACFFFSIRQAETSNHTRFITTLAVQLAENIPDIKWYIDRAVRVDSRIFTRVLESQVEGLILKPLEELDSSMMNRLERLLRATATLLGSYWGEPEAPSTKRNVIVIDGLDECVNQHEQTHVLRLIHELATHPRFPFRFVISSRPEYAIRTAFSSSPLSNDTLNLRLEEYQTNGDLRLLLKAEFSRLKLDHPLSASIPDNWPSTGDENALVSKASGQFVYVSVVMKHLANPRRKPILELRHILNYQPAANGGNPFTELDALYNRILHPPDVDIFCLKSILHSIIHDKSGVTDLDVLLGLDPGTTTTTLVDLHSVLKFDLLPRPTMHHKSLEDFLTSRSRAGGLYQSSDQTHVDLTMAYYELGRRRQDSGLLCDATSPVIHACSVSDWRLFKGEFMKNTLPAFIASVVEIDSIAIPYPKWLDLYLFRYHCFFCTSEGDCLERCQQLNRLPQLNLNLIWTYLLSEEWADGRPIELAPPGMLKVDTLVKSTCECTGVGGSKEKVMNFQTNGGNLSNAFKSVVQKSSIDSVAFQHEIDWATIKCKLAPSFASLDKLKCPSFEKMDNAEIIILWDSIRRLVEAESIERKVPTLETVEHIFQQNPFLELDHDKIVENELYERTPLHGWRYSELLANSEREISSGRRFLGERIRAWLDKLVVAVDKDMRDSIEKFRAKVQYELGRRSSPFMPAGAWETTLLSDFGVLRFPDLANPYIQVYHIRINAWVRQKGLMGSNEPGVIGKFHLRQYKPRQDVIKGLTEESQ